MSTQMQWQVTGTVDGISIGTFDSYSGGGAEASVPKHRAGGMGEQKSYAALPEYSDATIGRVLERERDVDLFRRLQPRVGRALASLSIQPLDDNGSPWGEPFTRAGRLSSMTDPEADSNASEPTMFQLSIVVTSIA